MGFIYNELPLQTNYYNYDYLLAMNYFNKRIEYNSNQIPNEGGGEVPNEGGGDVPNEYSEILNSYLNTLETVATTNQSKITTLTSNMNITTTNANYLQTTLNDLKTKVSNSIPIAQRVNMKGIDGILIYDGIIFLIVYNRIVKITNYQPQRILYQNGGPNDMKKLFAYLNKGIYFDIYFYQDTILRSQFQTDPTKMPTNSTNTLFNNIAPNGNYNTIVVIPFIMKNGTKISATEYMASTQVNQVLIN